MRSRSAVLVITNRCVRSEAVLISSGQANAVTASTENASSTSSSRRRTSALQPAAEPVEGHDQPGAVQLAPQARQVHAKRLAARTRGVAVHLVHEPLPLDRGPPAAGQHAEPVELRAGGRGLPPPPP